MTGKSVSMIPKITIVTPTYNSGVYLEKCILSIIGQTYTDYEHIIVDGGSTDNTLDILKEYEGKYAMRWISEPDEGMYDAINKGFSMAKGEIFAWLNSDDFYFPWALQVVARAFEKRNIQWLTGMPSNTKKFDSGEVTYLLPNLPTVFCRRVIHNGMYDGVRMNFIQQESCFWSRELWKKTGGLNPKLKMAGDYDLWKKFAGETALYTVHCNLASFRIHPFQKSGDMEQYYQEIGIKKSLKITNILLQIYLQLYSLKNYRKFVINLDEIMN